MDTTMSTYNDEICAMKSGQSNLRIPLNEINMMNSSNDLTTGDNPETLKNQVIAVSTYLLPRTTLHHGRAEKDLTQRNTG